MDFAGILSSLCALPLWLQASVIGLALFAWVILTSDDSRGQAVASSVATTVGIWLIGTYWLEGKCTW